jgi:hypothetical protein
MPVDLRQGRWELTNSRRPLLWPTELTWPTGIFSIPVVTQRFTWKNPLQYGEANNHEKIYPLSTAVQVTERAYIYKRTEKHISRHIPNI